MNTNERIFEAVISESFDVAIQKISTINVSNKAKTSEANIFRIFKNKTNLFIETFLYIDNQIGEYIKEVNLDHNYDNIDDLFNGVKDIWIKYIEFFKEHKTYIRYYQSFRLSKYYNDEIAKLQEVNFKPLIEKIYLIEVRYKVFEKISYDLFWSFLLDTTLLFSRRICDDQIEYNDLNLDLMFHLIFDGIKNIISTM